MVNNPVRASCYWQLRLIRAAAGLPVIPDPVARKVVHITEDALHTPDAVLYFAEPLPSSKSRQAPGMSGAGSRAYLTKHVNAAK